MSSAIKVCYTVLIFVPPLEATCPPSPYTCLDKGILFQTFDKLALIRPLSLCCGLYPDPLAVYPDPLDVYPDPLAEYPDPLAVYPDPLAVYPDPLAVSWSVDVKK